MAWCRDDSVPRVPMFFPPSADTSTTIGRVGRSHRSDDAIQRFRFLDFFFSPVALSSSPVGLAALGLDEVLGTSLSQLTGFRLYMGQSGTQSCASKSVGEEDLNPGTYQHANDEPEEPALEGGLKALLEVTVDPGDDLWESSATKPMRGGRESHSKDDDDVAVEQLGESLSFVVLRQGRT